MNFKNAAERGEALENLVQGYRIPLNTLIALHDRVLTSGKDREEYKKKLGNFAAVMLRDIRADQTNHHLVSDLFRDFTSLQGLDELSTLEIPPSLKNKDDARYTHEQIGKILEHRLSLKDDILAALFEAISREKVQEDNGDNRGGIEKLSNGIATTVKNRLSN